jgi:hypothetical protein
MRLSLQSGFLCRYSRLRRREGGRRHVSKGVQDRHMDYLIAAWVAKVAFEAGKRDLE